MRKRIMFFGPALGAVLATPAFDSATELPLLEPVPLGAVTRG